LNNNKLHKNSALFLAAVLVVGGVIGISSLPLTAYAQEYDMKYGYEDKKYDSYDPYKEKDGKSGSNVQIANCEPSNTVIIGINQEQRQDVSSSSDDGEETATLNGQDLTPEEALNALNGNSNGNGEPLLDINRNIVNVCFNNNDLDIAADFTGGEQTGLTESN
jgi:hypothetical protein